MMATRVDCLSFDILGAPDEQIHLCVARAVIAGYNGRDASAVQQHIDELAAIGVPPPEQVPMLYPVGLTNVTTAARVIVSSDTSGEVEPVIIRHQGRFYLGVGSDHTDRQLETADVGQSKRACPKPVGSAVIPIDNWESFDWDGCRMRSCVDGKLYQDGTLAALRTPGELLAIITERLGGVDTDLICFAGTIPLLDGQFVSGRRWDLELSLPNQRALTHTYTTEETDHAHRS
jgi:hypothetical protein